MRNIIAEMKQDGWTEEIKTLAVGYQTILVKDEKEIFVELNKGLGNRQKAREQDIREWAKAYSIYENDSEKVEEIRNLSTIEQLELKGIEEKIFLITCKEQ